ncbi:hypothetical protein LAJ55_14880, partial [Streptococcus pneumoniae]|uniref:hypothetical protein n=1 Tax=Streptococcus pneumoniae TaxID=1313 RepID=UPI001CBC2E40
MTINVTIGFNCNGESGLIERPQSPGLEPRVFRIVAGDKLEWCNRQDWHAYGWNRARSYGHASPASE